MGIFGPKLAQKKFLSQLAHFNSTSLYKKLNEHILTKSEKHGPKLAQNFFFENQTDERTNQRTQVNLENLQVGPKSHYNQLQSGLTSKSKGLLCLRKSLFEQNLYKLL